MADDDRPFLARGSQRKAQARNAAVLPTEPVPGQGPAPTTPAPMVPPVVAAATPVEAQAPPPGPAPAVTMDDVAVLTHASDYSRFVAPGVERGVSNAAMKKLFSDPHFNVMDGLDIYIGDYSQPDPIPPDMLRKMAQSKFLGLFDDEESDEQKEAVAAAQPVSPAAPLPAPSPAALPGIAAAAPGAADNPAYDDHTDMQLQPNDAAGRRGPDEGAGSRQV